MYSHLPNVKWREFFLSDIFSEIKRGRRLKKDTHIKGDIPYISSTALNNGVDAFIGNKDKIRKFAKNITLANSGSVGSCFYQDYEYIASDHVTSLSLDKGNIEVYLFLSSILRRIEEKYSFNREINDIRIKREKIILPAKENTPDWEYMRNYIKAKEIKSIILLLEQF